MGHEVMAAPVTIPEHCARWTVLTFVGRVEVVSCKISALIFTKVSVRAVCLLGDDPAAFNFATIRADVTTVAVMRTEIGNIDVDVVPAIMLDELDGTIIGA